MVYIPGVIRVSVLSTAELSDRVNVFNFAGTADEYNSTQLTELANSVINNICAPYAQLASNTIQFLQVTARDMSAEGAAVAEVPISALFGVRTGDPLPANVAMGYRHKTGFAGRKNRGRTMLYGWTEADTAGSVFNGTAMSLGAAVILGYYNAAVGLSFALDAVVASYTYGSYRSITHSVVDRYVDSQRTRLIGRGN